MSAITVFDVSTGRALRTIRLTGETSAEDQIADGETFVEGGYSLDSYLDSGAVKEKPERPSNSHEWDWSTKTWQPNAADAREKKHVAITQEFTRRTFAPILYEGAPFDADERVSRPRITGLHQRLERGDPLPPQWKGWRDENNAMHWGTATPAEVRTHLAGLSRAIEDREQALLVAAWQHKAALAALTTVEDILAYDVTQGW